MELHRSDRGQHAPAAASLGLSKASVLACTRRRCGSVGARAQGGRVGKGGKRRPSGPHQRRSRKARWAQAELLRTSGARCPSMKAASAAQALGAAAAASTACRCAHTW